jgi:hypothetical protein
MSESMAVTTNGVDPTDIHEKKNLNLQFILYIKIFSKWK